MSELQKEIDAWINTISSEIWQGIADSTQNIMDEVILDAITNYMMPRPNKYPSGNIIGSETGNLARALADETSDIIIQSNDYIEHSRTVNLPYAHISEYGGDVEATPKMLRAMFKRLVETGRYNPNYRRKNKKSGITKLHHKPFQFVTKAINNFSKTQLLNAIIENIINKLDKHKNIEVKIGH